MVNVDISNVWTCVSLPELLGREKDVFDAHNRLRGNEPDSGDYMGWLQMSASVSGRLAYGVEQAARAICEHSEILLVCGTGGAYHGIRAAIEAYCGGAHTLLRKPQVLFLGQSLCPKQWQELTALVEARDYSVLILSPDGKAPAVNVAARGLRWMLERKYGAEAKKRIFVATMVGTCLHTMAQEEGYELFPLPKQMGGAFTTLTPAALLPMAVAGIEPQAVLEGAVQSYRELDIRSFENPAWLYAGARSALKHKGRTTELLCVADQAMMAVGDWWQRTNWRQQTGICAQTVLLPGDLEAMDHCATAVGSNMFETMLHIARSGKKVPVEMDWKDYDGLGFLSGKNTDHVQDHLLRAMVETHNDAGVPVLDVDAGELTAENLGAMFCFFELSAALAAGMENMEALYAAESAAQAAAMQAMSGS